MSTSAIIEENLVTKRVIKLALIGQGGIGKTTMTTRWMKGTYEEEEEYMPTIEDSHEKTLKLGGEELLIEILDTAGQEEYEDLREYYSKDCEGFLLVYGIDDPESAEKISELFELIKQNANKKRIPIVLVGNKCDVKGDEKKVKASDMKKLADFHKVPFFEVSAKENILIDECFMQMIRECLKINPTKQIHAKSIDEEVEELLGKNKCCAIL